MAGRRAIPPRLVARAGVPRVPDPTTERAMQAVRDSLGRLELRRERSITTFDLVIGTNRIPHGLGRPVAGYTITPTVASAAFAHAIDRENPHPELTVWIVVIGAEQPGAMIETY